MLNWLARRSASKRKAEAIYGKVVAAARQPAFFGAGRVPDNPVGRLELVALHLFLAAERVKTLAPDGQEIARLLIEAFVTDMDDCMREMGVGDLTVPKRVKRAAAVFYERAGAYRAALADTAGKRADAKAGDALARVLSDALLGDNTEPGFASALAGYVRSAHARLATVTADAMAAPDFAFADLPEIATTAS